MSLSLHVLDECTKKFWKIITGTSRIACPSHQAILFFIQNLTGTHFILTVMLVLLIYLMLAILPKHSPPLFRPLPSYYCRCRLHDVILLMNAFVCKVPIHNFIVESSTSNVSNVSCSLSLQPTSRLTRLSSVLILLHCRASSCVSPTPLHFVVPVHFSVVRKSTIPVPLSGGVGAIAIANAIVLYVHSHSRILLPKLTTPSNLTGSSTTGIRSLNAVRSVRHSGYGWERVQSRMRSYCMYSHTLVFRFPNSPLYLRVEG
jgi:hypothetical protein